MPEWLQSLPAFVLDPVFLICAPLLAALTFRAMRKETPDGRE